MTCAPSFFQGSWDAVAASVQTYFSTPPLKKIPSVLVYGPAHLMRAAWLAGAVDYLKDPWEPEELFLRLRGPRAAVVVWSCGPCAVRLEGGSISASGMKTKLSWSEAELLRMLVERRGCAVPRHLLAWAAGCVEGRVVDTLVGRIRRKLAGVGASGPTITSVRGVGYVFP